MESKLTYNQVREAALCLKEEERTRLVEDIQNSLDETDEISPELKALLDRRFEELASGQVKAVSVQETLERIDQELTKVRAERKATSRSQR